MEIAIKLMLHMDVRRGKRGTRECLAFFLCSQVQVAQVTND